MVHSASSGGCRAEAARPPCASHNLSPQTEVADVIESSAPALASSLSPVAEERLRKVEALQCAALDARAAVSASKLKREKLRQSESGASPSPTTRVSRSSGAACMEPQQKMQLESGGNIPVAARGTTAQFEAVCEPQFSTQVPESQCAGEVPEPEEGPEPEEAATAAQRAGGKPKLFLPLPPRRDIAAESESPSHDVKLLQAARPMPSSTGPGLSGHGSRRTPAALRTGRQLPTRLQALDDQTVLPRDVYSNMLKLGDTARGRLGYGQHKLAFAGPEGAPVLRITA